MQQTSHDHKPRILLALVIVSLIAAPVFEVAALFAVPPVTTIEQPIFSEDISMTVSNGTMISSYAYYFQKVAEGLYNVSLPTSPSDQQVKLNESVSGIKLAVSSREEIPGTNSQRSVITDGYQWTVENQYASLTHSTNRQTITISAGIAFAESRTDVYIFDKGSTSQFNSSDVGISCEFILGVVSMSDGLTPSTEQNSSVLFSIGLSVSLLYERMAIPSYWTAAFISTLMFSIVGVSALVLFLRKPGTVD